MVHLVGVGFYQRVIRGSSDPNPRFMRFRKRKSLAFRLPKKPQLKKEGGVSSVSMLLPKSGKFPVESMCPIRTAEPRPMNSRYLINQRPGPRSNDAIRHKAMIALESSHSRLSVRAKHSVLLKVQFCL
jgi:hypothetical protein